VSYPSADAVLEQLCTHLPGHVVEVLESAVELSNAAPLYVVGGVVRDALLGALGVVRNLDLLVEASSVADLGNALQRAFGGTLSCHEAFLTCTLRLAGLELDLTTTRRERYLHPGALPVVEAAPLEEDLKRRDFSVNTFALRLTPAPAQLFGVPKALDDLAARRLRTLHDGSFQDDPTRLIRGSRLAARLGFDYDDSTKAQAARALDTGAHERVSPQRLRNELLLTLAEPRVAPALEHLAAQGRAPGALWRLYGLRSTSWVTALDALRARNPVPAESYVLALLNELSEEELAAHQRRVGWPRRLLSARQRLLAALRGEALYRGTEAERWALQAARPELAAQLGRPLLRGEDVLDLGLPAGPHVGVVLRAVARARAAGEVRSLEDERHLAQRLVADLRPTTPSQRP
jgi:tRNA nucleotidyltransferase (CCA-adding enzyme)